MHSNSTSSGVSAEERFLRHHYLVQKQHAAHAATQIETRGESERRRGEIVVLLALILALITTCSLVRAQSTTPCEFLCNASFEQIDTIVQVQIASNDNSAGKGFAQTDQNNIPCWKTTATDGKIEIWQSGYGSVPAYSGGYFAELNATQVGTLYQTFTVSSPATVVVSFAHRGRYALPDVMQVLLVDPPAAGGQSHSLGTYTDNDSNWRYYTTAPYSIPSTALGVYTLQFKSISSNGGNGPSNGGNFLDSITVSCANVDPCQAVQLCNTGFEQILNGLAPTGFDWIPDSSIPCWRTTASDSNIEIWHTNFGGVPAYSGQFFAELNATEVGTLYQDFTVTSPLSVAVTFAHRGRYAGKDSMKVSIVGLNPSTPELPQGTYADNDSAWRVYTTAPQSLAIGTYRLKFISISSNNGQGPSDGGNFLDSITVTCATPTTGQSSNEGCCDTAFFGVASSQVLHVIGSYPSNRDWRSINVVNHRGTPINSITLQYYDCSGLPIAASALAQLTGQNLHSIRNVPYLNRLLPGSDFPSPYGYAMNLNISPAPSNQSLISLDLGLPCNANPNCWQVRLLIEHRNPLAPTGLDTCYVTLPNWRPCPRIFPAPTWGNAARIDSLIYVSHIMLNEGVPGAIGFVSVATSDSTDRILGTSGAPWLTVADPNDPDSANPRIGAAEQSSNAALIHIIPDTTGKHPPTLSIFVGVGPNHQDRKYRPTLILGIYDLQGGLLNVDTVAVSSTMSGVIPVNAAAPQTGEIEINSVTPNPAHTTIEVRYTLGASEQAKLELFNTLGLQVGVLADGYQTRGVHSAHFIVNALPEGSYYLRLSTYNGQTSATVKVLH